MSEHDATKMEDMINETQNLIDTLETLTNEIESYQVAKNNLIDVKNKLQQSISQFSETSNIIKDNIIQINRLFNSELTARLEDILSMSEQSKMYFDSKLKLFTSIVAIDTIGIIIMIILLTLK